MRRRVALTLAALVVAVANVVAAANLVTSTEALDDTGVWTANSTTVTANSQAAPAFAGGSAGMADTVADNSAAAQGNLVGTFYTISADTSDYIGSVFIRKDAVTDRWPEIVTNINTGVNGLVSINTSTGAIADGSTPPAASGVVDVDANWWRLWMRIANDGAGTAIRIYVYPDHLDALGGSTTSGGTGSAVFWGFNITNDSTVQTYQPEPTYSFSSCRGSLLLLGVGGC